jgi:hypothetical protein
MEEMVEQTEQKPTSIVFDHCIRVWREMKTQAREEDLSDPMDVPREAVVLLVYEGHLTKLFANLGLSTPYYTAVMNHLKAMGCVEQLRRGGGNSPSRWALVRAPDEEAFLTIVNQRRFRKGKMAALEQQVRDLTQIANKLHARVQLLEIQLGVDRSQ